MKKLSQLLALGSIVVALGLSIDQAAAQGRGRGNFDPEQFRQRMMERYKEALEVTSDSEWKIIETRIQKVSDVRREVGNRGGRGMFGRRQGGNTPAPGGTQNANPEADALQKAIDAKAPASEIKAKLAKFREFIKGKEAELEAAQADLKKVLSVRQEAIAVTLGLLK